MGIDLLDINLRLERRYSISLAQADWEDAAGHRKPWDITAGEVQFLVGAKLQEQGRTVPPSLWHGVQHDLAEALRKPTREITPQSWLIKDLCMT